MIVSKEPIALIVSRVSREMMPCSNPVLTLSLPCVPTLSPYPVSLPCLPTLCPYPMSLPCVPTLCPCPACSRRSDRYEVVAMSGEERERGATSNAPPSWGEGSVA